MGKPTAAQLVNHARQFIGVPESPFGSNRTQFGVQYGMNGVAWCAIFTSCMFEDKDALDLIFGKQAYTPTYAKRFHDKGQWGTTPKTGALVFYAWYGPTYQGRWKGICHVEIVERVNADGTIITIGGNVSNKVCRLKRTTKHIAGYAYPDYAPTTMPKPPVPWSGSVVRNTSAACSHYDGRVHRWQARMKSRGWRIGVDGCYGPESERVCKAFQTEKRREGYRCLGRVMDVDGVLGPQTYLAAWSAPLT